MKKLIFLWACLLLVIPCQAKTITVEAPQPVSFTIEADHFDAGTNISTVFDNITLSKNGVDPVYAVTATKTEGLGQNVIGHPSESWGVGQDLRIDFDGLAKRVELNITISSDHTSGSTLVCLRAYNSVGKEIAQTSNSCPPYIRTLTIEQNYFDIAYITLCGDSCLYCLDRIGVEFLPTYYGSADFDKIQDAIDSASDGDIIEVLPGTYYERINFYGLSTTVTSTDPEDVNIVNVTIIDGLGSGNAITFDSLEDSTSILAGLTIQDADTGVYCYYSDPTIKNCVVKNNNVSGIQGVESQPKISYCRISANGSSNSNAAIWDCDGEISDCVIVHNTGTGFNHCDGLISKCVVSNNSRFGFEMCIGIVTNSIICGNGDTGIISGDAQVITNCTIVGNKGNGYRCSGGTPAILSNNIIVLNWGYGIQSFATLNYNNVWGNLAGSYDGQPPGETDTHNNPKFAIEGYWDADDNWVVGDYHLKSAAGRWTGFGWVYDDVNSPCIDAGDPNDSVGDEPNPNGGRINMGAYGGTAEASKSTSGIIEPVCTEYPAMDFNKDCKVDFQDFALFTQSWLDCNLDPPEACWE